MFGLPLKNLKVTSGYGNRAEPIDWSDCLEWIRAGNSFANYPGGWTTRFHSGVDLISTSSSTVIAVENGEVQNVGIGSGTGPFIIVDYPKDIKKLTFYRCLYAHLDSSKCKVNVGSTVSKGEEIGAYFIGRAGTSTGGHLHFEMRLVKKKHIKQVPSMAGPTIEYVDVEIGDTIDPAIVISGLSSTTSLLEQKKIYPRFAMLPDAGVLSQSNASVGGTNYYGGYENKRNYYGAGGFAALPASQNALESPINESMENTGNTASGSYSSFYNTNVHNASMNSLGEMSNQISNTFKQGNNDYSSGIFSAPSPNLINSISNGGNSYFSQSSGNPVNITGSQPINSRDGYRVSNFDTLNVSAHNNGTGIPGLNITGNEENTVNQITRGAMLNPIPSGYNKTINTTNNMPVNIHVENSNGVSGENVVSKLVKALKDAKADVAHNPNAGI